MLFTVWITGAAIALDEIMVIFFGRSQLKNHMPNKPIGFGFKIFAVCCAVTGMLRSFHLAGSSFFPCAPGTA